jgi:hypothetical protein
MTRGLRPVFSPAEWRIIQLETGIRSDDIKIVAVICRMCFAIYPLLTLNVLVIGLLCKSVEGNSPASRMTGTGPE